MTELSRFHTSTRLVEQACRGEAWDEFVRKYRPLIHGWCRKQGLDEQEAEDATQETFSRLMKSLKKFKYDRSKGKFRSWLWKTTNYAVKDMLRRIRRTPGRGRGQGGVEPESGEEIAVDRQDLVEEIAARLVFDEAQDRVLSKELPWHVEAWGMYREWREPDDIAKALDQEPNAVRVALFRIRRRIERTFHELCESDD